METCGKYRTGNSVKRSGDKNKSPAAVHGEGDDLSGMARAVEQIGGAGGGRGLLGTSPWPESVVWCVIWRGQWFVE